MTATGPAKGLWLTDPARARELERQAQLQNAATPGRTPGAGDPRRLSLLASTEVQRPCTCCGRTAVELGHPTYLHACCREWLCVPCHTTTTPAGMECVHSDEAGGHP